MTTPNNTKNWADTIRYIAENTIMAAITVGGCYWAGKRLLATMHEPTISSARERQLLEYLKRKGHHFSDPSKFLTVYERKALEVLILPNEIDTGFEDIGGLERVKNELHETVILPLTSPDLFASIQPESKLFSAPKGVLFYGPPGTGKTMIAKAIAKHCDAAFLSVSMSFLQNKWVGESEKICQGLFGLARKISPCMIFFDEIDLFFGLRSARQEHEVIQRINAEILTQWDGLSTDASCGVVVLGATNRREYIDEAVLRRLPRAFYFPLPSKEERAKIIGVLLKQQQLHADVDIQEIIKRTEGYCGSDLKEMCKLAALRPVREKLNELRKSQSETPSSSTSSSSSSSSFASPASPINLQQTQCRPVCMKDFLLALEDMPRSYSNYSSSRSGTPQNLLATDLDQLTGLLSSLANAKNNANNNKAPESNTRNGKGKSNNHSVNVD